MIWSTIQAAEKPSDVHPTVELGDMVTCFAVQSFRA